MRHEAASFDTIAFDGDDTLWDNETLYARTLEQFQAMLSRCLSPKDIEKALYDTEMRNLS